ncbi:MAG: GPW/gp25 family protein [Campylobacterales bacterium]|nr:GPW/gp25 family protein [Campylobacterales bacterium]
MAGISTITESVIRILKTPLGSRVMRPEYGSKLYELRDRKFDDDFRLKATRYTFEAIALNEPRVKVKKVDFKVKAVTGVVSIFITLTNGETVEVTND